MTFTYDSYPEDAAEAASAIFLRSDASKKMRIRNTAVIGIASLVVCLLILRERSAKYSLTASLIAGILSAAFNYFTYKAGVRKQMIKFYKDEFKQERPKSTYLLHDTGLKFESRGVSLDFSFTVLEGLHDRGDRLEVDFGKSGICLIPRRAFPDSQFEHEFTEKIRNTLKLKRGSTRQ
jgi:hypothetical protein